MMFTHSIKILLMFFAFSFMALSCADKAVPLEEPFSVTVIDSYLKASYSMIYLLDKDEIKVIYSGNLEDETDSVVYVKELTETEKRKVANLFLNFPLKDLKEKYIDSNVLDGSQKIFDISIGRVNRQIQILNYYQSDIGKLVDFINTLVTIEHRIKYDAY